MPTELPSDSRRRWLCGWRGGVLLVVVCVLALWPGARDLPPVDRDESRFAQASRQMLESGTREGWLVPRVGETPRLNKPPVIYWLQAASAAMLRSADAKNERNSIGLLTGDIWPFRLPSLLCALASTLITWRVGRSMYPREPVVAWLAGAMLGCSVMVMWDARQARADQLLLTATTAAMWALWRCWNRDLPGATAGEASLRAESAVACALGCSPRPTALRRAFAALAVAPLVLWLLVGLGVMSKGPITPMIVALTALALAAATGRWRWLLSLRPVLGLVLVATVVMPWVVLVAGEVGWSRYLTILRDETLGRSVSAAEGHWGPPGYHLVLLPALFWPGSMLTAFGLSSAWRSARDPDSRAKAWWRRFRDDRPAEVFLLAWLIPSWIVFELILTKLPHYTLPLYPALALLSARAVVGVGGPFSGRGRMAKVGVGLWAAIGLVLGGCVPPVLSRLGGLVAPGPLTMAMGASAGVGAGLVISAARAVFRGRLVLGQTLGLAAAVVASASVFGIVLPRLNALWVSSRVVAAVRSIDPAEVRPVAAVGYHEDSLTFLTNAGCRRLRLANVAPWSGENPGGLLVVPTARVEAVEAALGRPMAVLRRVTGFNYSKGEWVDLVIGEVSAGPAGPISSPSPERP